MCPHGGQVSIVSSNTRVVAGGTPIATLADQFLIAGCAFTIPPGKPQPCVRVQWMTPATRVLINGQPPVPPPDIPEERLTVPQIPVQVPTQSAPPDAIPPNNQHLPQQPVVTPPQVPASQAPATQAPQEVPPPPVDGGAPPPPPPAAPAPEAPPPPAAPAPVPPPPPPAAPAPGA